MEYQILYINEKYQFEIFVNILKSEIIKIKKVNVPIWQLSEDNKKINREDFNTLLGIDGIYKRYNSNMPDTHDYIFAIDKANDCKICKIFNYKDEYNNIEELNKNLVATLVAYP